MKTVIYAGALLLKNDGLTSAVKLYKTTAMAIFSGVAAAVVGLVAFTLSWNLWGFWGGPMPGFQVLLFPGHLTLVYIWHPLFTEEINFWPKLALLLLGQFSVVFCFVGLFVYLAKKLRAATLR